MPALPTSLHICFAASAAAFLLSVDAVVSGMSESTPESNAMTGMLAVLIWVRVLAAALLSRAAKPMASGFLASALRSMFICDSTSIMPPRLATMSRQM